MLKKLGSLFDGSGGFPLAGMMSGVEPVWASEIEPYPIRVTTARFPDMKHLGDVTKIDGAAIEPVDIITFGSPCQDLSVAGKRAGLHKGERSNLFFEAIRIIKEMRRSTNGIYPRIAIWENVPGAFSSNKGADFQAVLQAFCSVKDETADVPRPAAGKWNRAGVIVGDGWSIAWRTFDAQYWGVPQRRKRIYLIADFGSERAGEILFEQEGVRGDTAESGKAGEGTAGDAAGSVGGGGVRCLNPWDCQSKRIFLPDGIYPTLPAMSEGGANNQAVIYAAGFKYGNSAQAHGIGWQEEISPTLQAGEGGNQKPVVCYALQGNGIDRADTAGCNGAGWRENECYTLNTVDRHAVCYPNGQNPQPGDPCPTLHNDSRNYLVRPAKPPRRYIIRRLTPLECCRLQGFPDYWCSDLGIDNPTEEDISFWADVWETHRKIIGTSKKPKSRKQIIKWLQNPHSDSAEYKMWGNGLALPNAAHVVGCAVKLIKEDTDMSDTRSRIEHFKAGERSGRKRCIGGSTRNHTNKNEKGGNTMKNYIDKHIKASMTEPPKEVNDEQA